jgi:HEAT repeat protein
MIRTEFVAYAFMLIFGAIGAWGSREATPDLVWFLDNPGKVGGDALPRAYETLAELGAREAIPDILRKLKLQGATQGAARAAAIMGLKEAIPSLRTLLASENIFVVMEAAKALGQLGDRDSLPALRALLRHKDASIRTGASIGLAMLDDRDSIPRILEISRDKEGGYRDSLTPLLYFGLKDEFVVNLSGGDPRPEMVWAFGADLLPVFLQKLRIGDIHSRRNTLLALGYMPGDTALAAIRGMLQDPYEENRQSAYEMLCRRGEREGVARTLDTFNHRYKALPFQLNAVRTPEVWNRLKEKRLKEPVYASVKDLLGLIANEAGLALELPAGDIPERATWEKRYQRLQTWGRRMSLLEALEQLSHRHWMPILEKDRIRIVLRGEARGFWTDWSAKENR